MIPPEAEAILSGDSGPRLNVRKATFVGVVDRMAQVDMGDSRFVCDFGAGYIPVVGETVRVWSVGDQHLLFPAGPRPAVGTVLTVASGVATINTSTGQVIAAFAGTAPASGDRVGIVWSEDGPWCTQRLSNTPEAPEPIPDPGAGTIRSATFRAIDAGSTDRGSARWWTDQPWASESTFGAWFYGSQIKDTIPAGAQLLSMEMYISRTKLRSELANFTLHQSGWKQGVPVMSGRLAWDPGNGWNYVPNQSWFAALIGGGDWWGIGLDQGGWSRFSSLAEDSMSGALRISWRS